MAFCCGRAYGGYSDELREGRSNLKTRVFVEKKILKPKQ